tara:strand:- start:282 stop:413 length:132 start_codon:yes stop_codon:yes gene_type:complete
MTIGRANMGQQIKNPPNKMSKISQKRKAKAAKERKKKDGISTK